MCKEVLGTALIGQPAEEFADPFSCITLAPRASAERIDKQRVDSIGRMKDAQSPDKAITVIDRHHAIAACFPLRERASYPTRDSVNGRRRAFMQMAHNLLVMRQLEEGGVIRSG